MKRVAGGVLLAAMAWATALPAQDGPLAKGTSYIIQLTSSQYASGLGEYLVPPLSKALKKTGLKDKGGPGAEFAVTVESTSDVGAWYEEKGTKTWLYTRDVTVGLTPADEDAEPQGKLSPWFSVTARLRTENEDRVDELDCLIALAVQEMVARYQPKGSVLIDGRRCARAE